MQSENQLACYMNANLKSHTESCGDCILSGNPLTAWFGLEPLTLLTDSSKSAGISQCLFLPCEQRQDPPKTICACKISWIVIHIIRHNWNSSYNLKPHVCFLNTWNIPSYAYFRAGYSINMCIYIYMYKYCGFLITCCHAHPSEGQFLLLGFV